MRRLIILIRVAVTAGLLVAGAAPALADCYFNGQQVAGVCRFGVRAHPDAPRQRMSGRPRTVPDRAPRPNCSRTGAKRPSPLSR